MKHKYCPLVFQAVTVLVFVNGAPYEASNASPLSEEILRTEIDHIYNRSPISSMQEQKPTTEAKKRSETKSVENLATGLRIPIDLLIRQKRSPGLGPALKAKAKQLQKKVQMAYNNYCGKVHEYLAFISAVRKRSTPGDRCHKFFEETTVAFGIPRSTTVTVANMAAQEKLLGGMTQLEHTLMQTVTAITDSLKSTPRSCQTTSSNNPCDFKCGRHREPEQALTCEFHTNILPDIKQYLNLLKSETGKVSSLQMKDILVNSRTSKPNLRYHLVDIAQYALNEIAVNEKLQRDYQWT